MATSSRMTRHSPLVGITSNTTIWAMTFSADGEHLVSGGSEGVQVWRVLEDGKRVATMAVRDILCLAVSKDGRWIAAGTWLGEVIVWDAKTFEQVFSHKADHAITGVDFSPDSTRLLVASEDRTITTWDVVTRKQVVGPLLHKNWVIAAKYSPQGDRVATATPHHVRVYDSSDGRLLVAIPSTVTPLYNTGLLWANDRLFFVSGGEIRQMKASTGSAVSEWPATDANDLSCIAMPQHGEFIVYSTNHTVTFWDTLTHASLGVIQHTQDIRSITLSPDGRFLAIGGEGGEITIKNLSDVLPSSHSTLPFIHVGDIALDSWKQDCFAETEALLTGTITNSAHTSHHALANRALVRARLRHWDIAIDDAEESIRIRPSVIGYVAKSVALIGMGEKEEGCRVYDLAFRHCHSNDMDLLLLLKAIVLFMAGKCDDAVSRVDDLIALVHLNSIYYTVQEYMYLLFGKSRMESGDYEGAIQAFEPMRTQMRYYTGPSLFAISLITGWKFDDLGITIQQCLCEALYVAGREKEGGESLLKMINTFDGEVYMNGPIGEWISDFARRCLSSRESGNDTASRATRHDEATIFHVTLNPTSLSPLLREWAKAALANGSWKDALDAAVNFVAPRFTVYRVVCERLETIDHIMGASECFRQMVDELVEQTTALDERAEWVLDFKRRCSEKLEDLGDSAMSDECYDDAVTQYLAALSLDPAAPQGLFIKRSKAYIAMGLWEDALDDANKVITLDQLGPWGYKRKHAALHKAGDYENAIKAFEAMLSKMLQSSDPDIREHYRQYVDPTQTKETIRQVVQDAIRESPRMLVNTMSGRLLNKSEQAAAFESLPVFKELISSMTTLVDHARIEQEVTKFYRYSTFSHKWEENEPLFERVIRIVVYDLEDSLTHNKLQMFCKIVRDAGLHWAWSDTCCINRADHFVLQEALVAMFKWYQGSAVTIVLLRGVHSTSRRGDLVRSIWNTRAWTFQEYHASKVVRFYNEDWTLYMNLDIPNHKESPEIISEMEEATGISSQALITLRPGLNDIREKLCLASRRETTLVEDAAYSLLGIFSISLPVVYGEGNKALGRLLGQLLTSSGDTAILAWTGSPGSFNSCLPSDITVFNELPTSYIPAALEGTQMDVITTGLRAASLNITLVMKLYDRLDELPVPWFAGQRLKLPCIVFKLGSLSVSQSGSEHVFRAQTTALGIVEIRSREDLSRLDLLYLVHPWIDFLLGRQPIGCVTETIPEESIDHQSPLVGDLPSFPGLSTPPQTRTARLVARLGRPFGGRSTTTPGDVPSLRPPSSISQADRQMQALRAIARLRQPFGALLLTPSSENVAAYRRVTAESLITVQVEGITPRILIKLVNDVRILDVL